ncbi:hypothetical protein AAA072_00785 [Finegoldia magna]
MTRLVKAFYSKGIYGQTYGFCMKYPKNRGYEFENYDRFTYL